MTDGANSFGEALVQELLWIHDIIRRDLDTVRSVASQVKAGHDPAAVRQRLAELQTRGPLWQLKFGCLHYCQHVHGHHRFEDQAWFPGLRNANPQLGPTMDRLEAEHVGIAELLERIEQHAEALDERDDARSALIDALEELSSSLLAHLEFEEEAISPTLRTLTTPPWMVPEPS